jgi:hypothetical protein
MIVNPDQKPEVVVILCGQFIIFSVVDGVLEVVFYYAAEEKLV